MRSTLRPVFSASHLARVTKRTRTRCTRLTQIVFSPIRHLHLKAMCGGKACRQQNLHAQSTGATTHGHLRAKLRRRTRTRGLLRQRVSAHPLPLNGKTQAVCLSRQFCSADVDAQPCRLLRKHSIGITEYFLAQSWPVKQLPPLAVRLANFVSTRWRCCPFVVTTWPIISLTGCQSARKLRPQNFRRYFSSIGLDAILMVDSCGPATAKTVAY